MFLLKYLSPRPVLVYPKQFRAFCCSTGGRAQRGELEDAAQSGPGDEGGNLLHHREPDGQLAPDEDQAAASLPRKT